MIDYWRQRSVDGRPPARADIDPAHFASLAPQTFMAGRVCSGVYPLRLVGGFVRDLHGRDVRLQNALSLFTLADRMGLQVALEMGRRRPEPIVVTVDARGAEGAPVPMEILFAPLSGGESGPDRFLGLYQPLSFVSQLRGQPVGEFRIKSLRSTGPANEAGPRIRLAALDGRRIA